MARAVGLEQEASLAHALTPAAVARCSPAAGARAARRAQQPLQRGASDGQALPLGEQLRQMAVVDTGVGGQGQLEDARTRGLVQTPGRNPPKVAVDQAGQASLEELVLEAPDRPLREPQQECRLAHRQLSGHELGDRVGSSLILTRHGDVLPHGGRLTKSLSS